MKLFNIDSNLQVACDTAKTRNGFKHTATLLVNGSETESVKICYLNRTWEAYEYQSVLLKLGESKHLTPSEREAVTAFAKKDNYEPDPLLKTMSAVMAIGDIIADGDAKAANDWKARMLQAGLGNQGLAMPADWNELSEAEKSSRLAKVQKELAR